jgi:peroxiredoxin
MLYRNLYKFALFLAVAVTVMGPVRAHALKTGQPLPAFSVTTSSGQQVTNQNYSGRVLLLVFSTDFCSACKTAVPNIGKLAGRYGGKQDFNVLGLWSGFGMDDEDLKKYIKSYNVTYPMALFEQKFASEQFGVISVPYSLLVNKKGAVAGVFYGFSDGTLKQLEDQIKKVLAE